MRTADPRADPSADPAESLWQLWAEGHKPDLASFLAEIGPLPVPQLAKVVRVDQRQRWQAGEPVTAEELFRQFPALQADPDVAVDVIFSEFLLREKQGHTPQLDEYLRRFPRQAAELKDQIELHRALQPQHPLPDEPATADPSATPQLASARGPDRSASPAAAARDGVQQGDFVLLRTLGVGSFAQVYLAHQVSLNRKVALKVTNRPNRGEAQILARLEHDHIVKVYAEFDNPTTRQHGLVLQYVPGTNLARVLADLFQDGQRPESGQAILEAVDRLAQDEVAFDPAALGDRALFHGDYVTTVCRLGARLAEGLAFAHGHGVLHCDIKPANILLNRYGRPLLADFNVAMPLGCVAPDRQTPGGTLQYMAPEQLALFARRSGADIREVDQRADLYSLALVLLEAITGRLPRLELQAGVTDLAGELWSLRSQAPGKWLARQQALSPPVVWRGLRRCLDPDAHKRFASGRELAAALRNAADLLEAQRTLPPPGPVSRLAWRRPLTTLLILTLLPHLVGSAVNIAYNQVQIPLTAAQKEVFGQVILCYNLLVYPLCVGLALAVLRPLVPILRRHELLVDLPTAAGDQLRLRALGLGRWASALALLGWLPGGVIFPLALQIQSGPLDWTVFAHFLVSFTLSGLIALIYSYLGIQFVVIRSVYPRLLCAESESPQLRRELDALLRPLGWLPALAALVPLTGVMLLVVLAPGEFTLGFRLLVTALIGAGMLGLGVALAVTHYMRRLAFILMGVG